MLTARLTGDGRIQRSPFPNNIIPASRINPTSKILATWFPAPSQTGTVDGKQNIVFLPSFLPQSYWNTTTRVDHNLSAAHKLFGRLLVGHTTLPSSTFYGTRRVTQSSTNALNRDFAIGDVWTISPSFVADLRASIMRFLWLGQPKGVEIPYDDIGFGAVKNLFDTERAGYPAVTIAGYPQLEVTPGDTAFNNSAGSYNVNDIRTVAGHLTKIWSNHTLRFGTEVRHYINNRGTDDQMSVAFTGSYTSGPFNTSPAPPHGAAMADFLLGTYSSAVIYSRERPSNLATSYSFYLQDDWKVTRKLKLNLGIRYDVEGPATERFDQAIADYAFGADSPIASAVRANYAKSPLPELPANQLNLKGGLVFAGGNNPRTIYERDANNIAPRIGLVYSLNDKTVVRSGYGIFYIPYGQRFYASTGGTPGYSVNSMSYSSTDGGLTISKYLDNMFSGGLSQATGSALGLATFLGQGVGVTSAGRHLPSAYTQRWELSVQRLLKGNYKLDVRYVGTRTIKMPLSRNLNSLPNEYLSTLPERDQVTINRLAERFPNPFQGVSNVGGSLGTSTVITRSGLLVPYPHFSSLSLNTNQGYSDYHALQTELVRRFARGLSMQTSYVYSKTMDGLSFLNASDPVPYRVVSDQDRTHMWRFSSIWELPFGKGRWLWSDVSGVSDYLISGWQIQGITYINSGFPMTWGDIIFRGNIKDIPVEKQTAERMFNVDAGFERDPAKQLGSHLRTFPLRLNSVRTSTETNTDISIIKNTYVGGEKYHLQFRAEAYNIFNQHFYGYAPNTTPSSSLFGAISQATGSRTLQIGLRFKF